MTNSIILSRHSVALLATSCCSFPLFLPFRMQNKYFQRRNAVHSHPTLALLYFGVLDDFRSVPSILGLWPIPSGWWRLRRPSSAAKMSARACTTASSVSELTRALVTPTSRRWNRADIFWRSFSTAIRQEAKDLFPSPPLLNH